MLRLSSRCLALFTIIFACLLSIKAEASVTFIVSNPPPVREVVYPPQGYMGCYNVGPRYFQGVWRPAHRVCEYGPEGRIWIAGYWQCVRYQPYNGVCRRWAWVPSHYAMETEYEYSRPWRPAYQPVYMHHPHYHPVYYGHPHGWQN